MNLYFIPKCEISSATGNTDLWNSDHSFHSSFGRRAEGKKEGDGLLSIGEDREMVRWSVYSLFKDNVEDSLNNNKKKGFILVTNGGYKCKTRMVLDY